MGSSSAPMEFEKPKADTQSAVAAATVGLVSKAEFTRRREEVERKAAEEAATDGDGEKKKKKKKKGKASTLSFGGDDDDEEEAPVEVKKLKKNPSVDTSMLFDADRAAEEAKRKEALAKEWMEKEEKAKAEKLEVHYSYHDPSGRDGLKGHRNQVTIEKGFTIEKFLDRCRQQVPQLRGYGADQLIYIKEDLILPHSLTFHELIVKKARGKSGCARHPMRRGCLPYSCTSRPAPCRVGTDSSNPSLPYAQSSLQLRRARRHPRRPFRLACREGRVSSRQGHGAQRVLKDRCTRRHRLATAIP